MLKSAYAVRLLVVVLALVTQACGDDFDDYGLLSATEPCGGEAGDEGKGDKEEQALLLNGDRSEKSESSESSREKPAKDMKQSEGKSEKSGKEKSGDESSDCSAQSDKEEK